MFTKWASSLAVRALTYCAEDHGSGPILSQWLDARSVHPAAIGDPVETLGR